MRTSFVRELAHKFLNLYCSILKELALRASKTPTIKYGGVAQLGFVFVRKRRKSRVKADNVKKSDNTTFKPDLGV